MPACCQVICPFLSAIPFQVRERHRHSPAAIGPPLRLQSGCRRSWPPAWAWALSEISACYSPAHLQALCRPEKVHRLRVPSLDLTFNCSGECSDSEDPVYQITWSAPLGMQREFAVRCGDRFKLVQQFALLHAGVNFKLVGINAGKREGLAGSITMPSSPFICLTTPGLWSYILVFLKSVRICFLVVCVTSVVYSSCQVEPRSINGASMPITPSRMLLRVESFMPSICALRDLASSCRASIMRRFCITFMLF